MTDRVEIVGELLGTSDKAVKIKVTLNNGAEVEEWLPRSQLADQARDGDAVRMTIPQWLAEDRGFV